MRGTFLYFAWQATSIPCKTVVYNQKYGNLPTPTKTGYAFEYWHTADGTLISKDSINLATTDETLYAHWEKIKGDINADGEFNISDVVLLQKWLLVDSDVKLENWKTADLCENDKLDVFDLCLMKRMLIEKR